MAEPAARFRPASILAVLNHHGVDYVLIGGVAARMHGSVLRTGDVDICPQDTSANAARLASALVELEAKVYVDEHTPVLSVPFDAEFVRGQQVRNLLTTSGRLDVLWQPLGTSGYDQLAADAVTAEIRGVRVVVASLHSLIDAKQAAGRGKDAESLAQLRFIRDRRDARGP